MPDAILFLRSRFCLRTRFKAVLNAVCEIIGAEIFAEIFAAFCARNVADTMHAAERSDTSFASHKMAIAVKSMFAALLSYFVVRGGVGGLKSGSINTSSL